MDNKQSDSFFVKYRKAILTTILATGAVASAYYVYNNQLNKSVTKKKSARGKHVKEKSTSEQPLKAESEKPSEDETEKKKFETPQYPVKIGTKDEPDFPTIKDLDQNEIDKIAMQLKDKGNELFKSKDFENALKFYHWALELKNDPIFYSNISACYVSLNEMDKVVEYCTKALDLKPDYSKVILRRAVAYEKLNRYDDAMFDLSVLSLNNDFNGTSIEPILERNLNKQALKVLGEMLGKDETKFANKLPSNTSMTSFFGIFKPELTFNGYDPENEIDGYLSKALNKLYEFTSKGFIEADILFIQASQGYIKLMEESDGKDNLLKEKLATALQYTAIFKFLKNDLVGCQIDLTKSIELFPKVNTYIFMALTEADKMASSGATTNADLQKEYLKCFDKAIELDANNSAIYYHRGQIAFILSDYENAKKDFLKAKELDPENIFAYIQLACLSYREKNIDECTKQFDQTRELFPIAPEVPTFYAEILADMEDFDAATKQYEFAEKLEDKILEKNNGKIHVGVAPLIGKATVLARQPTPENFAEATRLFEIACQRDPRNEQAKVGLAQLKLQQEDVDTAIQLFEESAQLARSQEEKLQAITFAEAAKVQKRIRADPVIRQKVEATLAQYRSQNLM